MGKDAVGNDLEEELAALDVEDVYEDDGDSDETEDETAGEPKESDNVEPEGEADDEKKEGEKEETGKETSGEASTPESEASGEEEKGDREPETPEALDDQQRITSLMTEIDRLSGLLVTQTPAEQKTEETEEKKTDKPSETSIEDFVGDLDMDDVASDSQVLNQILNKVLQKGIETGRTLSVSQANVSTDSISQTVASQIENAMATKNMVDKFYDANPELSNVKQVVQACASQIVSENSDKTFEEILTMAADTTRKTLGISKSVQKTKITESSDVPFAEQKGGQRKKAKKVSKLQQELDEL